MWLIWRESLSESRRQPSGLLGEGEEEPAGWGIHNMGNTGRAKRLAE